MTLYDRCMVLEGPLTQQVKYLWRRQAAEWPMLKEGLANLHAARTREFEVGEVRVTAQCNPARIRSASAKVDAASLAARPCFLCPANLPPDQRAVRYGREWLILCNPAPLFDPHFTIAKIGHEPQRIRPSLETLLCLARDFEGRFTVFYNGPMCGASAPDHLHLQACPAGATPFENQLAVELCVDHHNNGQRWVEWVHVDNVRVGVSCNSHFPLVLFVGQELESLLKTIGRSIELLGEVQPAEPEPMLNLFATCADDHWLAWFYPRRTHRPTVYGDGPDDFLISPGAADLAGLIIAPRQQDFDRLDAKIVGSVFREVLLSEDGFAELRRRLVSM